MPRFWLGSERIGRNIGPLNGLLRGTAPFFNGFPGKLRTLLHAQLRTPPAIRLFLLALTPIHPPQSAAHLMHPICITSGSLASGHEGHNSFCGCSLTGFPLMLEPPACPQTADLHIVSFSLPPGHRIQNISWWPGWPTFPLHDSPIAGNSTRWIVRAETRYTLYFPPPTLPVMPLRPTHRQHRVTYRTAPVSIRRRHIRLTVKDLVPVDMTQTATMTWLGTAEYQPVNGPIALIGGLHRHNAARLPGCRTITRHAQTHRSSCHGCHR